MTYFGDSWYQKLKSNILQSKKYFRLMLGFRNQFLLNIFVNSLLWGRGGGEANPREKNSSYPYFLNFNYLLKVLYSIFCIVHGNWTEWSDWSDCYIIFSNIWQRKRFRTCIQPFNGGMACNGSIWESEICPAGLLTPFKF